MADFVPLDQGREPRQYVRGQRQGRETFGGRNSNFHRRGSRGRGSFRGGPDRGRGQRGRQNKDNDNRDTRSNNRAQDWKEPIEELGEKSLNSITFAIQGCCHGALDAIYERVEKHQEMTGTKIDVLLCCGDFQSLRSTADFHSLAVPPKYRTMGSFWKYYAGLERAPILTIFIGGNHEASQPLSELPYGGWVAPNIYYLGTAGVVQVGGVRIGGLSGIYKSHDYSLGRFEHPPYDRSTVRSVYHVRNIDVYRMKCLNRMDIMLSHDWPQGIEQYGNTQALLRHKPFFRDEIQRNDLGSLPNWEVLQKLKPKWWFSAHLHVKFAAQVNHTSPSEDSITLLVPSQVGPTLPPTSVTVRATDTTSLIRESTNVGGNEAIDPRNERSTQFRSLESDNICTNVEDLTDQMTRFLSLDKCLPRRQYLSIVHIPTSTSMHSPPKLEYDVEWLAILKKTHHLTVNGRKHIHVPDEPIEVSLTDLESICSQFQNGSLEIPNENFVITVPPYEPGERPRLPIPLMGNPQTDYLLQKLELQHLITVPYSQQVDRGGGDFVVDENEIELEDDDVEEIEVSNNEKLDPLKETPRDTIVPLIDDDENEILLTDSEQDELAGHTDEVNHSNAIVDKEITSPALTAANLSNGGIIADESVPKKARLDAESKTT